MDFPQQLKYKLTKPQGFPSSIKEVKFTPVANQSSWAPTEQIRWEIRSTGFLDPYSVRLNFDVQIDDMSPEEIRRLDGSAHSFFDQLLIQSRGIVIERIQEYQVLAQILHDMNYSPGDRKVKSHEGHGISDYGQGEFSGIKNDMNRQSFQRVHEQGGRFDPTNPCYPPDITPVRSGICDMKPGTTPADNINSFSSAQLFGTSNTIFNPALRQGVNIGMRVVDAAGKVEAINEQSLNSGTVTTGGSGYVVNQIQPQYFQKIKRNWQYAPYFNQALNNPKFPSGFPKEISSDTNDIFNNTLANKCFISPFSTADTLTHVPSLKNFLTLADTNVSSARSYIQNFREYIIAQFQNKQSGSQFLQSGQQQVQPWTYTTNDCGSVYEPAESYNNLSNVQARQDVKTYWEPGTLDKIQIVETTNGFRNPYNNLYCAGSDEPYFAGTDIQVKQIVKGKIESRMGRKYMSFSIPLLSSIFGVLLPPDLYKFIPLAIFEDLVIELQCSPYAVFSSGYKSDLKGNGKTQNEVVDNRKLDSQKLDWLKEQNTRNYRIVKMEMIADVMNFSSTVEEIIKQQWNSEQGIIIQTNFFALGPQYTYQNANEVSGTHQINLAFNSLRSMFWKFIPLDYERYSFCRKNFSINHNLTRFQLVLGQDLIPMDGVRGQAGTPEGEQLNQYQTNREFFTHMLKVFNKHHDMSGTINVNPYNFSINDRCYDPTKKGSYYLAANINSLGKWGEVYDNSIDQPDTVDEGDILFDPSTASTVMDKSHASLGANETILIPQNTHTSLQLPGFHETRHVGKSIFGFTTGTFESDNSVLSGLNTYDFKPFNITFETDQDLSKQFQRPSRLFMFFNYDAVVQLRAGQQPTVIGRA